VIFQHSILALLASSAISVLLMMGAAFFSYRILRYWDLSSGSRQQLLLERQTYLVSTILVFVMVLELLSLLLFVFTADALSVHFVGAMCAVGSLNANQYGFPALILKMLVFFAASSWLVLNHVDRLGRDYPLVRIKFAAVLALTPLLLAEALVQTRFFTGLQSNVSVACCSSTFSPTAASVTSDLSGLSPGVALITFYGTLLCLAMVGLLALKRERLRGVYAVLCALFFPLALVAILSVFSLYIYQHPHHHCPFCIFKPEYSYYGYFLYLPLFLGTALGLSVGPLQRFREVPSLMENLPRASASLVKTSLGLLLLFGALTGYAVLTSTLILFGQ
jgi:hypothetical protein